MRFLIHKIAGKSSAALTLGMLALLACPAVLRARVQWQPQTLREIYNPPGRVYAYAPCAIVEGKKQHLWMCRNATDNVIKDSIFYVQRLKSRIARDQVALVAGAARAWDSFHVCDPTVVAGKFRLNGARYRYAMFYTGNDVDASRHNQIGAALAKNLAGPWIKLAAPIIPYADDGHWGVGQPAAVNIDGKNQLQLFYTRGDNQATSVLHCQVDLSDANNPITGPSRPLSNTGLTRSDGKPDYLNNIDVAYDRKRRRYILVREQHPYPADRPTFIGGSLQIAGIAARDLNRGVWTVQGAISPALTGFARNHNAGFARDIYGVLPNARSMEVVFAKSCAGDACQSGGFSIPEWSYDLWRIAGKLEP